MIRVALTSLAAIAALSCLSASAAAPRWHVAAGPAVIVVPKYPGAADQEVLPLVDLDIGYGRLFLNSRHGAGVYLLDDGPRQAGASLWFRRGRDRGDSDRVADLEPIDAAPAAHAFFTQRFGAMTLSASATQTLAKGGGVSAEGSAAWRWQLSDEMQLQAGVRATIGDPQYMRRWFRITAAHARASGLEEYSADVGLASVGGFVSVTYALSRDWMLAGFLGCDVLAGDAADSPVVKRETMPAIAVSALHRFGQSRR